MESAKDEGMIKERKARITKKLYVICHDTGNLDELKTLFKNYPDTDVDKLKFVSKRQNDWWAVHVCCQRNHPACLEYLLREKKASAYKLLPGSITPLHLAAIGGHIECVRILLLLTRVPNIYLRTDDGMTALLMAAARGRTEVVQLLLIHDCDANDADTVKGNTVLHFACAGSYLDTVRALLNAGANVNKKNNQGFSVLDMNGLYTSEIASLLMQNSALGADGGSPSKLKFTKNNMPSTPKLSKENRGCFFFDECFQSPSLDGRFTPPPKQIEEESEGKNGKEAHGKGQTPAPVDGDNSGCLLS